MRKGVAPGTGSRVVTGIFIVSLPSSLDAVSVPAAASGANSIAGGSKGSIDSSGASASRGAWVGLDATIAWTSGSSPTRSPSDASRNSNSASVKCWRESSSRSTKRIPDPAGRPGPSYFSRTQTTSPVPWQGLRWEPIVNSKTSWVPTGGGSGCLTNIPLADTFAAKPFW